MTFIDVIYLLGVAVGGVLTGCALATLIMIIKHCIEDALKDPFEEE